MTIEDDGPVLSGVTTDASLIKDTTTTITLNFEDLNVGADATGATLTVKVGDTTFTGTQGEGGKWTFTADGDKPGEALAMNDDGTFTYTRPEADLAGGNNTYNFEVTVKDGDGDSITKSVTVNTVEKPGFGEQSPDGTVDTMVTDDSGLPGGNASDPGGAGETSSAVDNGSFTVDLNGREYTLTLTGKDGQKLTLELDAQGNLTSPESLEGVELEGNYGTLSDISVKDGEISYTYTQTGAYKHTPDRGTDESTSNADEFTVSIDDGLNDPVNGQISVTIEDDGPVFSEDSSAYQETTNSDGYWSTDKSISFGEDNGENLDGAHSGKVDLGDNNIATFYTGRVYFEDDRITVIDKDQGWEQFKDHSSEFKIYGGYSETKLGIDSGTRNNESGSVDDNLENAGANEGRRDEIGYDYKDNQAEAVIINLNKVALNINIDIKDFFGGTDEGTEKAIFLFYRNGELVGQSELSSDNRHGDVEANGFEEVPPGGFDTVVIVPVHNDKSDSVREDNSEFSIDSITFNQFDGEVRTLIGDLEAKSADGIESYGIDVTKLESLGLTSNSKDISYKWDSTEGKLIASVDGQTVFEISLNTRTGSWTMVQYKEYEGRLEIPFTATDGDGDTTPCDVEIKEPVQPSTAELTLSEAGMDNGSEASLDTESATGHLTLKEGATAVSITINEKTISLDPVVDKSIELKNGDTFTINDIADGKLTYTYTLGKARDHIDDGNQITENLNIVVSYEDGQESDTDVKLIINDDNMRVDIAHDRYANTGKITGISADGDVTYQFDRNSMPDSVGPWWSSKSVSWTIFSDNGTQILTGTVSGWRGQRETIFEATLDAKGHWNIAENSNDIGTIHFIVNDGDGDEQKIAVELDRNYSSGRMTSATGKESSRAISEAAAAAAMVGMVTAVAQHAAAEDHLSSDDSETSVRPEAVVQGVPATEGAEAYAATDADMLTATDEDPLALLDNLNALAEDGLLFENLRNLDADALEHLADSLENLEATTAEQDGDAVAGSGNGSMSSAEEESGDTLTGTNGDDLLAGDEGNDMLFGNAGNDVLLGMGGDDYLDGGEGEDMLFGGSGDDIIVYDSNDYLVDGGSGIDFMVSQDDTLSLDYLLTQSGRDVNHTGPIVNDVEVLITGEDALSLTNIGDLAKYGITLGTNARGDETLSLDMSQWEQSGENGRFTYTGSNDVDLTLETNLPPSDPATPDNSEAQTQVFILENSNG